MRDIRVKVPQRIETIHHSKPHQSAIFTLVYAPRQSISSAIKRDHQRLIIIACEIGTGRMAVVMIVIFDRCSDRIFPFQELRDLPKPFTRQKILELMVGFLGKWDVSGDGRKRPTDFFKWTRLAGLLAIEPAVPRNRLRLENTHFLRDSYDIYIP